MTVYIIPADRRTRGGHNQAYKHTTLGQNYFWHRTIPDWNSLPEAAIESRTVAAFKSQLVDYKGGQVVATLPHVATEAKYL